MANEDIALMAHLMRRAGFGAGRDELEARVARGYDATVDEMLNPPADPVDRLDFLRYQPGHLRPITSPGTGGAPWLHTLLNTHRPLEEKMVLLWHNIFATGQSKVDHYHVLVDQVDMFRRNGMGSFHDLLLAVAKDPGMLYWLDNNDNHEYAVNENFGRELLELFSMGVGNYTEDDVRDCSRAFTGWTVAAVPPRAIIGRFTWDFEYVDADHDHEDKTFLGHTGDLNGEDIIDIICEQPATARFICRHLYSYFVADEAQVPAWSVTPPRDPEAVETLAKAFMDSKGDMRTVLGVLFKSEFFKNARFTKIKSPAEVVVGTLRFVGGEEFPAPGIGSMSKQAGYMGQDLLNPPSVEGWHTGVEWVNSGALMKRINFASKMLGDVTRPGILSIISRLKTAGALSPEAFVDTCLDLLGPLEVHSATRQQLVSHATEEGDLRWGSQDEEKASTERLGEMLKLIASAREFQYA